MNKEIGIPELALVVLIGPSGAGKSTFAHNHFLATEVVSSDFCRGLVADDENDQSATGDAFDILHTIVSKRLKNGRLAVVDATNIRAADRQPLVALARDHHVLPVAIVLNLPESVCQRRNAQRPERQFGPHVVRNHVREVKRSLKHLKGEGFRRIIILNSEEEIAQVRIHRERLWNNRRELSGPFDIIGDVHGCATELEVLLARLGYEWTAVTEPTVSTTYHRLYHHPHGRTAIFLGDLVDRGPRNLDSYQLVRHMVTAGHALCVPGNHDVKLMRQLNGRNVQVRYGLDKTLAEIEALPAAIRGPFSREMADWIDSLISHYVLADGKLVVAHAGLKAELQGRASGRVREFALYGETTGETDEYGLPVRHNWAFDYRGQATVVYGHTPVPQAEWLNNTINIDTGCVFGGHLTALRYPERELVAVPAAETYVEPIRPLHQPTTPLSAQQIQDDLLDIADISGKRLIETNLLRHIIIPAANNSAALEVMSRFAISPQWLIYLPPTMSPTETSQEPEWLEHPASAFDYFRQNGVAQLVCEEKHMGSRAVVIVARDEKVIQRRFGVSDDGGLGIIYTRTGRRFFNDGAMEQGLLAELHQALTAANFWSELETDWVCLDCELMPWSEKAQTLIQDQYAAVGAAARAALADANERLQQTAVRGIPLNGLDAHYQARAQLADRYIRAYQPYCWPVNGVADLKLAPFHILATEGAVHSDKTHLWHMAQIARFVQAQPGQTLMITAHHLVELGDSEQETAVTHWWQQLTENGGEGMVIKPINFVMRGKRGLIQPAVKCRGRDYLRIIYGPEYTLPYNLNRLRQRNVARKRFLALREFALGLEALERFVRREPLRRVHECVFAVLAMESEPVDPRL